MDAKKVSDDTNMVGDVKRPRVDDSDDLASMLMNVSMNADQQHPCSTCPGRVAKAIMEDWNHWVLLAQDEEGLAVLQKYFNMYVKLGYGVSFKSAKCDTGLHVLMCSNCMTSYRKMFQKVATSASPEQLPAELDALRSLPQEQFVHMKIIARLLCHQMCSKVIAPSQSSSDMMV